MSAQIFRAEIDCWLLKDDELSSSVIMLEGMTDPEIRLYLSRGIVHIYGVYTVTLAMSHMLYNTLNDLQKLSVTDTEMNSPSTGSEQRLYKPASA